jgi:predicted ATP-binding protein involved in virulence
MKLTTFKANGLNHIESISIPFHEKLNFVTGVNGSGKTSVLTAIVSLIVPNLEALADLKFEEISIEFELDGKKQSIAASKNKDGLIKIRSSETNKSFQYIAYEEDDIYGSPADLRAKYYNDIIDNSQQSPVIQHISNIPTPMYLGLDRRYRGSTRPNYRLASRSRRRRKSNIFGSSLGDSLYQAIALAEERYQQSEIDTASLKNEFVEGLVLELLDFPDSNGFGVVATPTTEDRALINQAKNAILQFPKVEGISTDDIRSRIEPTLNLLSSTLNKIPDDVDLTKLKNVTSQDDIIRHIIQWTSYKPAIHYINKLYKLINAYNDKVIKSKTEITKYISLIEKFIGETGKKVFFDNRGSILISYQGTHFPVFELSSGEAQIFVLLTHLSFNTDAKEAGVFIIDEPELSLHILWQEILVESLLKANDGLQYILATHSPSVILDEIDAIIDISVLSPSND